MDCRVCGVPLPEGALFCGECGSSVTAARLRQADVADPRSRDTMIVEPLPRPARAGTWPETGAWPDTGAPAPTSPALGPESPGPGSPGPGSEPPGPGSLAPESASPAGIPRAPSPEEPSRTSFTLTFSSGGSAPVSGPVLVGRRPEAQPGERFERLISISDPGRSVSKTHLELGLEGEYLWVCDRFSANGTVLRPPGGRARLCEPGRRYRVGRGTRIEIGEQFIDVS